VLADEESDDNVENLEEEVIVMFNRLLPFLKRPRGRKEGRVSEHNRAIDQDIRLALNAGNSLRGAVRESTPEHQRDTHRRRQQRRRKKARELEATSKKAVSGREN
jgi:hypothetical protein